MTAVTTIQRAQGGSGASRLIRRLGAALSPVSDRIAAWSAAYYEGGIAEELEGLPPSRRTEAVLRWHARQGRTL